MFAAIVCRFILVYVYFISRVEGYIYKIGNMIGGIDKKWFFFKFQAT